MVGRGGTERLQWTDGAAGSMPLLTEDAAAKVLDLLGDPSAGEVHLTSRPESAATARRPDRALLA